MLVSLSIRDIVLIEKIDLEWQPTLCTLTGETGAGKSILLDALGLATGVRGDAGLVRQGCTQGSVTAVFKLNAEHGAQAVLRDNGLDGGQDYVEELILRRLQTADGRSRAFCNDQPIGIGMLAELGKCLLEIHGQNESQSLTDAATQRALLDRFAGLQVEVEVVAGYYASRQEVGQRLAAHREALTKASEETGFLRHALVELRDLDPRADEEAALADERTVLMNAEKITDDLHEAEQLLHGESGVESALNAALRRLERAAPSAAGMLDAAIGAIDRTLIEAAEARAAVSAAKVQISHNPDRLEQVEDRLFALRSLARKHNVTCSDLPDLQHKLSQRLDDIEGGEEQLATLELDFEEADKHYCMTATDLSKKRIVAARQLDIQVNAELPPLKLDGGAFTTRLESVDAQAGGAHGLDRVRFEASTNPGMAPGPIAKIASGGELARFMLALKVCLAEQSETCTLIFDEVDAGVGGAVAEAVGVRLHRLARRGQILVVTHSPQVAARGNYHWQVHKSEQGNGMATQVTPLLADDRLEEVARMLSGAQVTEEARAAARRLLEAD